MTDVVAYQWTRGFPRESNLPTGGDGHTGDFPRWRVLLVCGGPPVDYDGNNERSGCLFTDLSGPNVKVLNVGALPSEIEKTCVSPSSLKTTPRLQFRAAL